jgi:transcription elongation GreA/GreB family factor/very-short-patch-repair endonuclease
LEWQRLTRQLAHAERQHANVIGGRYYQREETDFEALTRAVENAQRAVQLAGSRADPGRLARQLAVDGAPDPAVLEAGRDVQVRVGWLLAEAEALMPESRPAVLEAPLTEVRGSAELVASPLQALVAVLENVAGIAGRNLTLDETREALEGRVLVADAERRLMATDASDSELLGPVFRGGATDWATAGKALDWSIGLRELTGEVTDETAVRLLAATVDPGILPHRLAAWEGAAATFLSRFESAYSDHLGEQLIPSFNDASALLDRLGQATGDIDEWLQHVHRRRELADAGLEGTVADCMELSVPADQLVNLIERALLEGWADKVAQRDARLRDTRRQDRDRLVEEFRDLDRELIRRSAAQVIERCNELRTMSTVGQAGIIQAQASLRRRHKPIRRLLAEAGDVAKRLKPCFMMSPLSVSSFLPPAIRFDVVVFDEASQVRPCDSINCIHRADRLIVAGDQRQLPPSSFFDARVQDGESVEDDEAEVPVFDSILDQCKGAGFPSLSLQWHYRSQHESLIAFSNASFYDGSLLTFPGALARAPDLGVELYRVAGTYRSKPHNDNPVEAATVAERVLHYAELNRELEQPLTVGVVTFSDAQEDCVVGAIEDLRARRPDLDGFFRPDRLKGFFVKNLESVQGDERDVMIFSVGYAYDLSGRFALRMGPLTTEGGQRRLNVAITRARRRVEVVASVGPDDFRGEIKEGGGVWHLREYLAYVGREGVLEEAPRSTGRSFDSDLEESVARTLETWGFRVEPQVGMARYRVDLGVRRPDDPSRFLLGIECDGAMYHSSRVARDRDRLRHMVLTGLGWNLYRIWSPAWYRDRQGEEERLRAVLKEVATEPPAIRVRREPEDVPQPEVRVVEPEAAGPPPWTLPYRVASPTGPRYRIEMHLPEAGADIRRMVMEVVEVEAPVSMELALRRVREAWGVGSAGTRIQANFIAQVERLRRDGRVRVIGEFIWAPAGDLEHVRTPEPDRPASVRRVEHVPPHELDVAMAHVASEAIAASFDQLTESVAKVFGWKRRGADIRPALAAAVERLIAAGRLEDAGDVLRWVGEPPANRRVRRVTDELVEPRRVELPPSLPAPTTGSARTTIHAPGSPPSPVQASHAEVATPQLPPDVDRCLTAEGHQDRLKDLRLAEDRLVLARQVGDPTEVARASANVDSLQRLLAEVRVLPPPADNRTVRIGCHVSFRDADGPEETWQLVPPLEANNAKSRMSALTPIGQSLFGHAVGDVIEVPAPSGTYLTEILAIEVP